MGLQFRNGGRFAECSEILYLEYMINTGIRNLEKSNRLVEHGPTQPQQLKTLLPDSATVVSGAISLNKNGLRSAPISLRGASVAVCVDAIGLLRWLAALDGLAARIVVIPITSDEALRDLARTSANLDFVVDKVASDYWARQDLTLIDEHYLEDGANEQNVSSSLTTEWVLPTSGTTNTPKLVVHNLKSLTRSMRFDKRYSSYRWGLLFDPARFAGMQVFLQALLNGSTLLSPLSSLALSEQVHWLARHQCNAISATPTLWRKILMTSACEELPLQQVTLGGEIADTQIINALQVRFPKAKLTHVYASTEAGVGFSVQDGLAGFPAGWLDATDRNVRLRIGENGSLWIAPPFVSQRYLGAISNPISRNDGWIDTGDIVRVEGDRVYFSGRANGSINVGGNKVFPEEIENAVLQVPGVVAAAARGRPNSVMGSLVEVSIVPGTDAPSDLTSRVKSHCKRVLPPFKVPAFVKLVENLGMSASGKIER